MHGVNHLLLSHNVIYKAMGHNIFIEDGVETANVIEYNLVVDTRESWSLLVTDQTPASFWLQHPDNTFVGNHAAGSAKYGFHFDMPEHPTGPSADPSICPINAKLGVFANNTAHSNGRYGLRVHHGLVPRQYPCLPISDTNPSVEAVFENFVSYKNKRNGMISERLGAVVFKNFTTADNGKAGMEVSLVDEEVGWGECRIKDGLVIGRTDSNSEAFLDRSSPHGIIGPRSDNFVIDGTRFVNFEKDGEAFGAALGTCSHCFHSASTDSGARTITTMGLKFDDSVPKKISYQFPYRAIFYDEDGSLTGIGVGTWASAYWLHNVAPECMVDQEVFDGIICDNSVQVRRVAFHGYEPSDAFRLMDLRIARWDSSLEASLTSESQRTAYLDDIANYSVVPFKAKKNPANGHAVPFVTGHSYRLHWDSGLDFTQLKVEISD